MDDGHHSEAEQVNLDDAEIGAVLFVPLNDCATGHRGAFQRHNVIQLSLADHHASAVLSEVARQVSNPHRELDVFGDTRMANVEACMMKGVRHRIGLAAPFPLPDKA